MKKRRVELLPFVLALLLVFFIASPLLMVFMRAVVKDGSLDIPSFFRVLLKKGNLSMIKNSLLLSLAVVALSTLIAFPLAYALTCTKLSHLHFLDIIFMIPFMTPPYIASMGWILFMQKKGLLQQIFPSLEGSESLFFNFFGLALVMSLHVFPFLLTILKNAIQNIPSSLEDAASVFGAASYVRVRRILFPLLSGNYAIGALLVFVKTLSEYGTPSTLGRRIGYDVFTTEIHRYATVYPIDFGSSATLASLLVTICLLLWMMQNHITEKRSYKLIGGKAAKAREAKDNKALLAIATLFVILIIFLAIVIPYFSIITTSLIKLRGFGLQKGNFTFEHYINLFTENRKGINALLNSLFLSLTAASIAAIIGTLVVVAVKRSKSSLKKALEAIALLPEMLPSIVLVIGLMLFWNSIYKLIPLYNTIYILVIAYVVLFLPYTVQYVTSSFSQISSSLLEAGRVFGASPSYIFRKITLPLIFKGVAAGWMMTFIISFRELVTASLIAPPNTLVVSTYIVREFEQGSVSTGMAMAVICVLSTTTALIILNRVLAKNKR